MWFQGIRMKTDNGVLYLLRNLSWNWMESCLNLSQMISVLCHFQIFNVIVTLFSMSLGGFSEDYLALYKTAYVQNTLCERQLNYTEVLLQPRFRKCKTCVNILGRSKCSFVVRNGENSRHDIFPSASYPPTWRCLNDKNLIALWHYIIRQFIKKHEAASILWYTVEWNF